MRFLTALLLLVLNVQAARADSPVASFVVVGELAPAQQEELDALMSALDLQPTASTEELVRPEQTPGRLSALRSALRGDESDRGILTTLAEELRVRALVVVDAESVTLRVFLASEGRFFAGSRAISGAGNFVQSRLERSVPPPAAPAAPPERGFWSRTWPYWVGGALLAVALGFFIAGTQDRDEAPGLVIRFGTGPGGVTSP